MSSFMRTSSKLLWLLVTATTYYGVKYKLRYKLGNNKTSYVVFSRWGWWNRFWATPRVRPVHDDYVQESLLDVQVLKNILPGIFLLFSANLNKFF